MEVWGVCVCVWRGSPLLSGLVTPGTETSQGHPMSPPKMVESYTSALYFNKDLSLPRVQGKQKPTGFLVFTPGLERKGSAWTVTG